MFISSTMKTGFYTLFFKDSAGRYWLKGFLERNPEVKKRKAQKLNPPRAQKVNKLTVEDHFVAEHSVEVTCR